MAQDTGQARTGTRRTARAVEELTNQEIILEALAVAEELIDLGRGQEACDYLREWVLPLLARWNQTG